MHLITGFILANLLGRKKKRPQSPLLDLGGPIETKHLLPGRVRFQVLSLVGDHSGTEKVTEQVQRIEGVRSVEVNEISGSVLIRYRHDIIQPEILFVALVRLLGLEKELEQAPQPTLVRELRDMGEAANRAVYVRTGRLLDLWSTIPLVLGIIGARKLLSQRNAAFPAGVTMIWWAYSALFRGRHTTIS